MKLHSRYRVCLSKSIRVYIAGISKGVTRGGVRKERVKARQVISRYLEVGTNFIFGGATRAFPVIMGTSVNRDILDNILIAVSGYGFGVC